MLPLWWRRRSDTPCKTVSSTFTATPRPRPRPVCGRPWPTPKSATSRRWEDPTVNRLRDRVCELLGKEDAVFLPSGTMGNQVAIRVHCRLGDEVIADRTAPIVNAETGGTAANAGVMIRMVDGPYGVFTGEQVEAALRDPNSRNAPRSRPGVDREHVQRRLRHRVAAGHHAGRDQGRARCRPQPAHGRCPPVQCRGEVREQGQRLCRLRRLAVARLHQGPGRAGRRQPRGLEGVHQGGPAPEADAGRLDAPVRRHRRRRALCPRAQLGPPGRGPRQCASSLRGHRQHQGPEDRRAAHGNEPDRSSK